MAIGQPSSYYYDYYYSITVSPISDGTWAWSEQRSYRSRLSRRNDELFTAAFFEEAKLRRETGTREEPAMIGYRIGSEQLA